MQVVRAQKRALRTVVWLSPALVIPLVAWAADVPVVQSAAAPPAISVLVPAAKPKVTPAATPSELARAKQTPKPTVRKPTTPKPKAIQARPTAPLAPTFVVQTPAHVSSSTRTGPTGWATLDDAIARIPTYYPGMATWRVQDQGGHWGTTMFEARVVSIAPTVPADKVYDVAVHEWSHILSTDAYGGNVDQAFAAMRSYFGGTGTDGTEIAADCMARLQGADWTFYTPCTDPTWRAGAQRLINGQQL